MDPVTILIWAAVWAGVSAGIYVTVYFLNLTFYILADWFRKLASSMTGNDVGFTVRQAMNNGTCTYVQGIFDTNRENVKNARVINTSGVDSEVNRYHDYGRKEVAIYT
jgi:hypothetical protein